MNVESIRLINFRNYTDSIIELNENTNIFVGKNAQGKTNLLEAIYICATGKSFRTNKDRELINFNKKAAYIGAKVKVNDKEKLIEIKIDLNGQKRIKLNKIELKSQRELDSGISVVIFSPEDLKIVKDGPMERRNFLDMSISQIRPVYKHNLSKYNKILLQRNNLLKSGKSLHEIENLLDIFDMQLVKTGTDIITTRLDFVKKLSDVAFHIHSSLTKGQEKISIEYNSAVSFEDWDKKSIEKEFIEQIYSNRQKDLLLGATSIGPHRDDMSFMINGKDARIYASQGQQRTIVLTIKLAEVEILKIDKGVYPVLLLDDVFSELDLDRRRYLVKAFNNSQTVITTTEVVDLDQLCSEKKIHILYRKWENKDEGVDLMFLHIGGDDYVFKDDIVAILDVKTVNSSKDTSRLIEKMIRDGLLKNNKIDDAKTYIITCRKGRRRGSKKQYYLYMSNISSSTLLYRNNRRK